jgi:hypothetical protein
MNHQETSISGSKYQSFLNFSNTLFIQLQNLSIIHNSLKIEAKSLINTTSKGYFSIFVN